MLCLSIGTSIPSFSVATCELSWPWYLHGAENSMVKEYEEPNINSQILVVKLACFGPKLFPTKHGILLKFWDSNWNKGNLQIREWHFITGLDSII